MAIKKPLVVYNGAISELQSGDSIDGTTGGGSYPVVETFHTIDFGVGNNLVSVDVTDLDLTATDKIILNISGTSSTIHHNQYEHVIASKYIKLSITEIIPGTGFSFVAYSDIKLTGSFQVQCLKFSTSAGGGSSALSELSDVNINTPSNGQVLMHNGTEWVNSTISTGGSVEPLDMQDTQIIQFIPEFSTSNAFFYSGVPFSVSNLHPKITNTIFSSDYSGVNDTDYGRVMGALLGTGPYASTNSASIRASRAVANGNGGYYFNFYGGYDKLISGGTKSFIGVVVNKNSDVYQNLNINNPFNNNPAFFGIGCEKTDTNLQFMHKSKEGSMVKVDMGSNFLVSSYTHYRIEIKTYKDYNVGTIYLRVTNLFNGAVFTANASTDVPLASESISPSFAIVSDNGSTEQNISFVKLYMACRYKITFE